MPAVCPECNVPMAKTSTMLDFVYDWQGEAERDEDGYRMWAEFNVYTCGTCACAREIKQFSHWVEDETE